MVGSVESLAVVDWMTSALVSACLVWSDDCFRRSTSVATLIQLRPSATWPKLYSSYPIPDPAPFQEHANIFSILRSGMISPLAL